MRAALTRISRTIYRIVELSPAGSRPTRLRRGRFQAGRFRATIRATTSCKWALVGAALVITTACSTDSSTMVGQSSPRFTAQSVRESLTWSGQASGSLLVANTQCPSAVPSLYNVSSLDDSVAISIVAPQGISMSSYPAGVYEVRLVRGASPPTGPGVLMHLSGGNGGLFLATAGKV